MKIIYAEEFGKRFKKLPPEIQRIYRRQEAIFQKNWRDPRLHIKKLTDQPYPFSFRVTRRYRVFFIFVDEETVLFATIWHRREAYRK